MKGELKISQRNLVSKVSEGEVELTITTFRGLGGVVHVPYVTRALSRGFNTALLTLRARIGLAKLNRYPFPRGVWHNYINLEGFENKVNSLFLSEVLTHLKNGRVHGDATFKSVPVGIYYLTNSEKTKLCIIRVSHAAPGYHGNNWLDVLGEGKLVAEFTVYNQLEFTRPKSVNIQMEPTAFSTMDAEIIELSKRMFPEWDGVLTQERKGVPYVDFIASADIGAPKYELKMPDERYTCNPYMTRTLTI